MQTQDTTANIAAPRVFGIAGYSGAGKTTLIEGLLPRLRQRGLKVAVIKQTHHDVDPDPPGKDSRRHRAAGAGEVILAGPKRWVLTHECEGSVPTLVQLTARLAPCDLVLVEGFRHERLPKLEVFRPELSHPPLWPNDPAVVAVASSTRLDAPLPCFLLGDWPAIAEFVLKFTGSPA